MRDRRAVASDAGLTGAPDESGARRREQGLARAGNARVRRGMIQLAWRFLMFQRESTDGPTAADARNVMVEGASGILAISPGPERPLYEPSKRRLTWPNDDVGMRLGADPRTVVTTTPRPAKLIRDLVRDPICVVPAVRATKIAATWRRHFLIRSFANTKAPGSAGRSSTPSCSKTRPARCGRTV